MTLVVQPNVISRGAAGRRAGRRADPRDTQWLSSGCTRGAAGFLPGMKPVLIVGAGPVGLLPRSARAPGHTRCR